MINIVMCDDSVVLCEEIKKDIKKNITFENEVYIYNKYDSKLENYIENASVPTLYILDIDLKQIEIDGLIIAKKIRRINNNLHQIIFLTQIELSAIDAINFKINPVCYLLKTKLNKDILMNAINEAKSIIDTTTDKIGTRYIEVHVNRVKFRFDCNNIVYFELVGDKMIALNVLTDFGSLKQYRTTSSVKGMMLKVSNDFFQISRTTVINKKHLKEANPDVGFINLSSKIKLAAESKKIRELLKCLEK